jgi:Fe2+ transport system protein FeoA
MTLRILPVETKQSRPAAAPVPRASMARNLHEVGAPCRVRLLSLHMEADARRRLDAMGLREGVVLRLLRNDHRGTVAVELAGKTMILGRRESYRMRVRAL